MKLKCKSCPLVLNGGSLCAVLTSDEIEELSERSHPVELAAKAVLDGDKLDQSPVLAILDGTVGIQHVLEDGRRTISAFFTRGDILDLRRGSGRRQVSVRGLRKSRICKLDTIAFDRIQDRNPSARALVTYNLREQAHRSADHAADLAKKQAIEKVASFMFECHNRQTSNKGCDRFEVVLPMRQYDLAEYLGIQPETLSRNLRELNESDVVEVRKPTFIVVRNPPKLRRLANGAGL